MPRRRSRRLRKLDGAVEFDPVQVVPSERRFSGWLTVSVIDRQGDIVVPEGITADEYIRVMGGPLLEMHSNKPIGRITHIEPRTKEVDGEEKSGAFVEGFIFQGDPENGLEEYPAWTSAWDEIVSSFRDGDPIGLSLGGEPEGTYIQCENDVCHRVVPKTYLEEISLVRRSSRPANPESYLVDYEKTAKNAGRLRKANLMLTPGGPARYPDRSIMDAFEKALSNRMRKAFQPLRFSKPFAGYKDFDECVDKNRDKDDPDAYCGSIKHDVEDAKKSLTRLRKAWAIMYPHEKERYDLLSVLGEAFVKASEDAAEPDVAPPQDQVMDRQPTKNDMQPTRYANMGAHGQRGPAGPYTGLGQAGGSVRGQGMAATIKEDDGEVEVDASLDDLRVAVEKHLAALLHKSSEHVAGPVDRDTQQNANKPPTPDVWRAGSPAESQGKTRNMEEVPKKDRPKNPTPPLLWWGTDPVDRYEHKGEGKPPMSSFGKPLGFHNPETGRVYGEDQDKAIRSLLEIRDKLSPQLQNLMGEKLSEADQDELSRQLFGNPNVVINPNDAPAARVTVRGADFLNHQLKGFSLGQLLGFIPLDRHPSPTKGSPEYKAARRFKRILQSKLSSGSARSNGNIRADIEQGSGKHNLTLHENTSAKYLRDAFRSAVRDFMAPYIKESQKNRRERSNPQDVNARSHR